MKSIKITSDKVKYNANHTVEFEIPCEMMKCGTLTVTPQINEHGKYEFTLTLS